MKLKVSTEAFEDWYRAKVDGTGADCTRKRDMKLAYMAGYDYSAIVGVAVRDRAWWASGPKKK